MKLAELLSGTILARAVTPLATAFVRKAMEKPTGAGLSRSPIRFDPRFSLNGAKKSVDKDDIKRLASTIEIKIEKILEVEFRGLADNEISAATGAVEEVLIAVTPIVADDLFELDLDPAKLMQRILEVRPGYAKDKDLGQRGIDLFHLLLSLCCTELVEFATSRPEFLRRAAVDQIQRSARVERGVEQLRLHIESGDEDAGARFERKYRNTILRRLDRLQIFGVTLSGESTYPLSTAYMSLCATGLGREAKSSQQRSVTSVIPGDRVEQMMSTGNRLVIRGGAGSGKTTLLHWLAVCTARGEVTEELAAWATLVPFFIPLRQFVQKGLFPKPEEFMESGAGGNLAAEMPVLWVHDLLRTGRALVLVDGVDEVPESMRPKARKWLSELVGEFPDSRYIVTSRPPAVDDNWLASDGFSTLELLPMSPNDVRMFIKHWHDAAKEEASSKSICEELTQYEQALVVAVTNQRQLGRLATNPLLCALLCALYRDRKMQLPRDRMELYNAALEMLLTRRDAEREIVAPTGLNLSTTQSARLIQKLAYWLISNGYSDADRDSVVARFGEIIANMPKIVDNAVAVYQHLLLRSGLIREPVMGRVDFVHRTFEEFLGAKEAIESENFGVLINHAHEDQWHGVFAMAVGHARPVEQERLLTALLDRGSAEAPEIRARLHLLAAACLEYVHEIDPAVLERIFDATSALIPPRKFREAQVLATAGDMVLELLPPAGGQAARTAASIVRTAALIGGPAAIDVIKKYRHDSRVAVRSEIVGALSRFEKEDYAREVLSGLTWVEVGGFVAKNSSELKAVEHIASIDNLAVQGNCDLTPLSKANINWSLHIFENPTLLDFDFLKHCPRLKSLHVFYCENVSSMRGLENAKSLRYLNLRASTFGHRWNFDAVSNSVSEVHISGGWISSATQLLSLPNIRRVVLEDSTIRTDLSAMASLNNSVEIEYGARFVLLAKDTSQDVVPAVGDRFPMCVLTDSMFTTAPPDINITVNDSQIDKKVGLFEQLGIPEKIIKSVEVAPVPIYLSPEHGVCYLITEDDDEGEVRFKLQKA
ncbi:NACHT domain-containing protein [Nocardia xishanensis]|uniref:NACHT domain-containing protein n=1 Tax=Nocardia xishanensis TaxID=238964 RepID=UPI0034324494